MHRWWGGVALLVAITTLTAGGCPWTEDVLRPPHEVEVVMAQVDLSAPSQLMLVLAVCQTTDVEVTISESRHEVHVAVVAEGDPFRLACRQADAVVLEEPLGDRRLVDVTDGSTVEVRQVAG